MVDRQIQTSTIKSSQTEVYDKASDIIGEIVLHAESGCIHCLEIVKKAVGPLPTAASTGNSQQTGDEYWKSRDYSVS